MKRVLAYTILCLALGSVVLAQQSPADAPATKEDIEKYLEVTHSRELMLQSIDAMAKPMHDMVHQQYLKDKDKLPADFEARVNRVLDDMLRNMPWDEMMQAMVPIYQKHFTKGDLQAVTAFYSTPTGQKLLREMPALMADAMTVMMPAIQKHIADVGARVQEEMAELMKDTPKGDEKKPATKSN